jgi:hypothetical protein
MRSPIPSPEYLEIDDQPICSCGHIHCVHDVYRDDVDEAGAARTHLGCSRCACLDMNPVMRDEVQ